MLEEQSNQNEANLNSSNSKIKNLRKMLKKKKRSSSKRKETYSSYIYKVLKEVHPSFSISSKSMSILNSFLEDMFDKIVVECVTLVKKSAGEGKTKTIDDRVIQSAAKLILPGELAKHAVSEGTQAVAKFKQSKIV